MHPDAALLWLRRAARETRRAILDGLCPPSCPACGEGGDGLCRACSALLTSLLGPRCLRCGLRLPAVGARCVDDHRAVVGLDAVLAPWAYRGSGGRVVRRFKFDADPASLAWLVRGMATCARGWARCRGRRGIVVAVPQHRRKRRERGRDPAAILAERVAQRLELRIVPRALGRVRDTLPQGDPRVTSRPRNVEGAFAVRRARRVRGAAVLLVDDVATSLTTARECGRVLREAGATRVALLVAARARLSEPS